jgi:putative polyhydroxyalkanoate system protein
MSMIVIRRTHELGLAKARRLAQSVARQLQRDYGGTFSWSGNDLEFQRTGASGSVAVSRDSFEVRVELGFLLRALRSRIEREILKFCDTHFGAGDRARPVTRPRRAT